MSAEENLAVADGRPKGAILKEAREKRGLSLETVHEATKIPLDAIRAIEEGYTIRTLSTFYLRGFIKIYARYLNVDLRLVLGDDYVEHNFSPKIQPRQPLQGIDLDDILTILKKFFTPYRTKQIFSLLGVLVFLFILFKLLSAFMHPRVSIKNLSPEQPVPVKISKKKITSESKKTISPVSSNNTSERTKAATPSAVVAVEEPSVTEEAKSTALSTPVVEKNIVLTVRALADSWLNIKVDGQVVFQSTLKSGATETWRADKEVEIAGKNINRLQFELNGKMIGTLGRQDRNAKKVLVTKDGLNVTK